MRHYLLIVRLAFLGLHIQPSLAPNGAIVLRGAKNIGGRSWFLHRAPSSWHGALMTGTDTSYLREFTSTLSAGPQVGEGSNSYYGGWSHRGFQNCTVRGNSGFRRSSIACCCWSPYSALDKCFCINQLGDGAATLKLGTDSMTPIHPQRDDPRLTDNDTQVWRTAVPSVQTQSVVGGCGVLYMNWDHLRVD